MTILQQAFAESIAARFGDSSERNNSRSTGLKYFDENELVVDWRFRQLVGCLMWPENQTRPDIANAVRAAARYANKPTEVHWSTTTGILKYVILRVIAGLRSTRAAGSSRLRLLTRTTRA